MAWHFDETTGHHVTLGDNAALTLPDADWTIGGWIKLDDNAGSAYQYFLSWGGFGANPSINWLVAEATEGAIPNKLRVLVEDSDGDAFGVAGTGVTSAGTPGTSTLWQHLAVVRSGTALTQYVNGAADGTETDATVDAVDVADSLYLGMRSDNDGDRRFGGRMAEWAKWDRALSTDELTGLAAGYTPDHYPTPTWQLRMWGADYSEMRVPLTVTNQGSTAADHPGGLIYPSTPQLVFPAAVAPGFVSRKHCIIGGGIAL